VPLNVFAVAVTHSGVDRCGLFLSHTSIATDTDSSTTTTNTVIMLLTLLDDNTSGLLAVRRLYGSKCTTPVFVISTSAGESIPSGLGRSSAAARFPGLRVRILPGAWMSVCCECCVLSGRGLCDELITRPEESYRLGCV
jgi:hypothetical protein